MNDIGVHSLSISSHCGLCVFFALGWPKAGLQAPGGTLAAIYTTLRRYLPTIPPGLTELHVCEYGRMRYACHHIATLYI